MAVTVYRAISKYIGPMWKCVVIVIDKVRHVSLSAYHVFTLTAGIVYSDDQFQPTVT